MQRAIEVFALGFCFTRSFTHPYLPERVGGVWVVRDGPRKRGDRREEWVPYGLAPKDAVRFVHKNARAIIVSVRSTMPMRTTKRCERSMGRSIIVWVGLRLLWRTSYGASRVLPRQERLCACSKKTSPSR